MWSMEEVEYVDVASGRGSLAERMARKLDRPMIATDFSARVLRRDQDLFRFLGLLDRVSLLAFDARQTPLKDGLVKTITSNLGLSNIENPGRFLQELRRVIDGELVSIVAFTQKTTR